MRHAVGTSFINLWQTTYILYTILKFLVKAASALVKSLTMAISNTAVFPDPVGEHSTMDLSVYNTWENRRKLSYSEASIILARK